MSLMSPLHCLNVTSFSFWVAMWLDVVEQLDRETLFFYDRVVNLRKVLNICSEIYGFFRTCNVTHFQQQSLFVITFHG